jgi:ribonuclease BN (tRNA processing enzyme)
MGETFAVGDVRVQMARLNHSDPVYGYRLEYGGTSIVYATDTEHFACVDPALARLASGADVLIYDAQYTPEEYPGKVGWGHSTWEAAVALARQAGVRQLVLYHHDPRRSDDAIDLIEARAQSMFPGALAAREGAVLRVEPLATSRAA